MNLRSIRWRREPLTPLAVALALLGSCGSESATPPPTAPPAATALAAGPLVVAVVNYPLAYLTERIGGAAVEVRFPVPAGIDPAFWEPTPDDIVQIQAADLILLNGAGYAAWTRSVTLPLTRVRDTSSAFHERLVARDDTTTHSHGPEGEHAHGATAFTTWLDPELALLHAEAVRDALARERPAAAGAFDAALASLSIELEQLDARLAAAVARDPERALLFSHPVYDYLTHAYDIRGVSLHWEPDALPTAKQWLELEQVTAEHGARWMVWEGEPLGATREGLRARGIESVVFEPAGNRPDAGDLLSALTAGAEALEQAYGSP